LRYTRDSQVTFPCPGDVQGKPKIFILISPSSIHFPCQSLFLVTRFHTLSRLPKTTVCPNIMRLLSIAVLASLPIAFGLPVQVRYFRFLEIDICLTSRKNAESTEVANAKRNEEIAAISKALIAIRDAGLQSVGSCKSLGLI
jgi:hypothetical protein